MFYQSFGKNYGDPYYEPTIVVHDMNMNKMVNFICG